MVIFPLAPDQTIAQMRSNGARGRSRDSYQIRFYTGKTWILCNKTGTGDRQWTKCITYFIGQQSPPSRLPQNKDQS